VIERYYLENYDKMVKRAWRALGDYHLAEDCVQETFERALKYQEGRKAPELGAWMSVVLFNTILKYLKFIREKGMTNEASPHAEVVFSQESLKEHLFLVKEEIELFSAKPKVRIALDMYLVKGYTSEEVNVLTNMSENSIKGYAKRFKKDIMERYNVTF